MNLSQCSIAMRLTLEIARSHMEGCTSDHPELDWDHLVAMANEVDAIRTSALPLTADGFVDIAKRADDVMKANRYVGWLQAAVVTGSMVDEICLDTMREINRDVIGGKYNLDLERIDLPDASSTSFGCNTGGPASSRPCTV